MNASSKPGEVFKNKKFNTRPVCKITETYFLFLLGGWVNEWVDGNDIWFKELLGTVQKVIQHSQSCCQFKETMCALSNV